jgi:Kef-type K+ transport system membrane component KefB/voltage-gated potassium channel Kch
MHSHLLQDLGLCIVAATALAYVGRLLRQPLVLAYIAAGVLIGPIGLRQITEHESIQTLSELGLALLLFIVGLEIDLKKLVSSGKVASVTTIVQVAGSAALGWGAAAALGYHGLPAAYVGITVAFSSTMIVVKLLVDHREIDTLPGQVTLGVLLVQDVLAIVVLAIQPNLGGSEGGASPLATMALSVAKGLGLAGGAVALSRYVLPHVFRFAALSPEIMLGSAISWCFLVSFAAMKAGFSVAMGALIAGVSISTFPYSLDVVAKIRPLRDFFVTIFLVSLGMLLTVPTTTQLVHALVLSGVAIVSRGVTVWPVLRALRYDNRVGILSSLHLAQISEFALVIVLTGVSPGFKHIDQDVVSLVVLVLVITATASTYLIQYAHAISSALLRLLERTPLEDPQRRETRRIKREPSDVLLVGCFRIGSSLVHRLRAAGRPFSVIDFSPKVHAQLEALGVKSVYGDVSHMDTLEHAGVDHAKVLISSIQDDFLRGTDNRKLLDVLRRLSPHGKIIVVAESLARAQELYAAGADYVILPRLLAADRLFDVLESIDAGKLDELRAAELEGLRSRTEVVA